MEVFPEVSDYIVSYPHSDQKKSGEMFIQLWFQTYTTYCDAQTINIVSDSAITFVLLMHNSRSLMLPSYT